MPMEIKKKLLLSLACSYRKGEQNAATTVKDEDGNLLFEDSEIRQRWKHYFETLLDVPENIENLKMPMHI